MKFAMKTRLAMFSATALLAGLAVNEYRSQQEQVVALHRDLQGLRQQHDRWRVQSARPGLPVGAPVAAIESPAPAALDAAATDRGDDDDPSPAAVAARWEEQVHAHEVAIEDAFTAQAMDGSWAAPARDKLRVRLSALSRSTLSSLGNIDCRSSICRVEIWHRDRAAAQQFASAAFTAPEERAWDGPVLIAPAPTRSDGTLASVMYLGREVASLSLR
jgi:hypothetical protein